MVGFARGKLSFQRDVKDIRIGDLLTRSVLGLDVGKHGIQKERVPGVVESQIPSLNFQSIFKS